MTCIGLDCREFSTKEKSTSVIGVPFRTLDNCGVKRTFVVCECQCGNVSVFRHDSIRKSCKECSNNMRKTRGGSSRSRIYKIWNTMVARCTKESQKRYKEYGGRGITVCNEWMSSFESFRLWAESNGYKDNLTIDRIDNSSGYCPENCRWSNMAVQSRNRRSTKMITAWGETKTQEEWARDSRANVQEMGIIRRLRRGMSPEDAISKAYTKNKHLMRGEISAWGETKTNTDWTRDPRCSVSLNCLRRRLKSGMTPEEAISLTPK